MHVARAMLLYDERKVLRLAFDRLAARLGRHPEIAFLAVELESHWVEYVEKPIFTPDARNARTLELDRTPAHPGTSAASRHAVTCDGGYLALQDSQIAVPRNRRPLCRHRKLSQT